MQTCNKNIVSNPLIYLHQYSQISDEFNQMHDCHNVFYSYNFLLGFYQTPVLDFYRIAQLNAFLIYFFPC